MKARHKSTNDVYNEFACCKGDNIKGITILLKIMMTRELREWILLHEGPSSDKFDTPKLVFHWTDSVVISRHLGGHNSTRAETHQETAETVAL